MAEYFNLSNTVNEVMVQNDDSRDKKVMFSFEMTFRNNLETNVNNQNTDQIAFNSAPLNSEWFTLRQIYVREQISFGGNVAALGPTVNFSFGRPPAISFLPYMREQFYIGFSDAPIVGTAPYFSQNNMFIPVSHSANGQVFDYSMKLDEVFHLKKNKNYINAYVNLTMTSIGDVTVFWDLLRNHLGTNLGDTMRIQYNFKILVYGVLNVDYKKRIEKNLANRNK